MKRILQIILMTVLLFNTCVLADGVTFKFIKNTDGYTLEVYNEYDKIISYNDAINDYGVKPYLQMYYDGRYLYFENGKEINEEVYLVKSDAYEADLRTLEYGNTGIRVHNANDIKKAIQKIYEENRVDDFHLVYSFYEYDNIDFDEVMDFFKSTYLSPLSKNYYTYREYGEHYPLKYFPNYDEKEMRIQGSLNKISLDEKEKLNKFLDEFILLFENKSDYEKILGVYTYLRETVRYESDSGYTNFQEALLSPYDVLLENKGVCIGISTTFQLLMEKLGLKSYIVDSVVWDTINEGIYNSTHTYNIVYLDDTWYIVDVTNGEFNDGFLRGKDYKGYNEADFKEIQIDLNDSSYLVDDNIKFDFDYKKIDELKKEIFDIKDNTEIKEPIIIKKDNTKILELVLLVSILFIVGIVIIVFTRK